MGDWQADGSPWLTAARDGAREPEPGPVYGQEYVQNRGQDYVQHNGQDYARDYGQVYTQDYGPDYGHQAGAAMVPAVYTVEPGYSSVASVPAYLAEPDLGPGYGRGTDQDVVPAPVHQISSLPPERVPVPATQHYAAQSYALPSSTEPSYTAPSYTTTAPTTTAPPTYGEPYEQFLPPPTGEPYAPPPPPPTGEPYEPPPAPVAPAEPAPDPLATHVVAVGTVQPREPRPAGGSVEEAERVLTLAVDSLHATPDMYSLGGVADGAVCLLPEDGRWSVFLAEGGHRRFAGSFYDPELAAVHFAGVLLLLARERGTLPRAAGPGELPGQSADPLAEFLAGPPIVPLAGDPPSSLYAERRLTVMTPGTEVDRFGDQEGNTVYAARTRYAHRSLPPDFIDRDYRVYRVLGPVRAVTGQAVPWFGQPGGGIVYLLPRPIKDLIREGLLAEIPAATVAPV